MPAKLLRPGRTLSMLDRETGQMYGVAWANLFARDHPIADTGKLALAHATLSLSPAKMV